MNPNLQGKTIVITGANAGIGLETSRELARMNAHVVMIGRNQIKLELAAKDIRQTTGTNRIDTLVADLSSQAQIHRLAQDIKRSYPKIDVFLHNAGVFPHTYSLTEDGIETAWAVNLLAPFLLNHLLTDHLLQNTPARVILVSSSSQQNAKLDLERTGPPARFNMMENYGRSKLAATMFTYELARRFQGTGVTVNCLHPGSVRTDIGDEMKGLLGAAWWLMSRFLLSPQQGALTSIYAASAPELEGVTGQYLVKTKPERSNPISYDQNLAERVWNVCAEMTSVTLEDRGKQTVPRR
jgi:NAD(P)-dependent dehydrogenase (short-subunit alcohol dehydrogenase family)